MSKELLDELREVKQEIRDTHEELTEINMVLKSHPLKVAAVVPGASKRAVQAWVEARAELLDERQALVDRLLDLEEDKKEIVKGLDMVHPIKPVFLASVIEKCIEVEMLLPDQPEKAHERITNVIDWLEKMEGTLQEGKEQ